MAYLQEDPINVLGKHFQDGAIGAILPQIKTLKFIMRSITSYKTKYYFVGYTV